MLVHCASGVSRSVTICAAFLMTRSRCHVNMSDAPQSITRVRTYANPNLGFKKQLKILEKCKNDIDAANDLYCEHASNVVGYNSSLHAKVDEIEVSIAALKSKGAEEGSTGTGNDEATACSVKNSLKSELMLVQAELYSCLPDELFLVYPPSKMIRKPAVSKVERLLNSLQEKN